MEVRWDAVVQDNGFWSDAVQPPLRPSADGASRRVQVWLFGSLADGVAERPVAIEFKAPFTIGDVIAELGHRCGRGFLESVADPGGGIVRTCRVFVNGEPVDDATMPIQTDASQTDVELILLTAAEGG